MRHVLAACNAAMSSRLTPAVASAVAAAIASAETAFPAQVERLRQLVRVPSCSFPGFEPAHVQASAEDTAAWLRAAGFPEVTIRRFPADNPLPYVVAYDRRAGPQAPTVLLYAHHDVQPPLRTELWRTPPYEPTVVGERLYARGAADDKAGVCVHAAAAAAWNAGGGAPVNLIAVIEGEEEIGSPHMAAFIAAHADELRCDVAVIADLGNVDTGLPSITTSLRGNVKVEVELRALRAPLHSGMWGNAVPDPAMALVKLLATLTDDAGRITVPGLAAGVREPTAAEADQWRRIPHDPARLGAAAGLLHAAIDPDPAAFYRRLWREPALAITSIQSGVRGQTGNVIMDAAWAAVGLRIVPDQEPRAVMDALCAHLRRHAPAGMELTLTERSCSAPWGCSTAHPYFAACAEALAGGYGVAPVEMGCGATIPFVGDLCRSLGGIPALLVGVEDPACGAHAENESVHLGDLRKAVLSEVRLFAALARAGR